VSGVLAFQALGGGILTPAASVITGQRFLNGYKLATNVGHNDIYTCPTGKRAIVVESTMYNHAGISSTIFMEVKISGTYYPTTLSVNPSDQTATSRSNTYILEAGESVSVNISAQPVNVFTQILEFDNTANIRTVKITSFGAGDNTVYTVPGG